MPQITMTFTTTAAKAAKFKAAMEWRADRNDPDNAPHTLNTAGVTAQLREICVQFMNSERRAEIADKRRIEASAGDGDDDID